MPAAAPKPLSITLLGTGTPSPSLDCQSSGCLIGVGHDVIVWDHGPGAHHRLLQSGHRSVDVTHAFFTHTIVQDTKRLSVEYASFSRYDLQPPQTFTHPLDGSVGRNTVMMGRGEQIESSRTQWNGQTLTIITTFHIVDRGAAKPFTAELTRKLWLESPPIPVVEVTRAGVSGGPTSTTRSVYRKG